MKLNVCFKNGSNKEFIIEEIVAWLIFAKSDISM